MRRTQGRKEVKIMTYLRPEVRLIGPALAAVQNTSQTKKGIFVDTSDLPVVNYINDVTPPAYEADE